jgi:hypothetical protein
VGRIAFGHQRAPARQQSLTDIGCRLLYRRWAQCGEGFRDLLQIRVGLIFEKIVHRRVPAPPVAKRDQLVRQIAGRLAGKAREIIVGRPWQGSQARKRASIVSGACSVGCARATTAGKVISATSRITYNRSTARGKGARDSDDPAS